MRLIPAAPCLGLIHEFEQGPNGGFAATRYADPSGYPTIGWGHRLTGILDPLYNATINLAQADALALKDLTDAATGVCAAIPAVVGGLTDGQYAACIDFAFNLGVTAFRGSTLCFYIRTGNLVLAPGEFVKWDHERINGVEQVSAGLLRRRQAEVACWRAPTQ
jgi:lysozyme